jgi:opacity protein-like surface antigen
VFGGEVAVSFMNWSDRTFDVNASATGDHIDAKISNLVTGVAKLGYAFDSVLVYGAIGAARVHASWTATDSPTDTGTTGSVDFKKWGLALGGGVTVALAGPWSVGVEGMYIKFNDRKDASLLNSDSDSGDFAELKNIWLVKGTLNYKFDWGKGPVAGKGPVVARY